MLLLHSFLQASKMWKMLLKNIWILDRELESEILVGSSKWTKLPAFHTSFLICDIENNLLKSF
jgi:hypothetical protein